jgi:hypothetical protein
MTQLVNEAGHDFDDCMLDADEIHQSVDGSMARGVVTDYLGTDEAVDHGYTKIQGIKFKAPNCTSGQITPHGGVNKRYQMV